jgi:hypothetical protein
MGATEHYVPVTAGEYPREIPDGQSFQRSYSLNNNLFEALQPTQKVKFVVLDTNGIRYRSKGYRVSDLRMD